MPEGFSLWPISAGLGRFGLVWAGLGRFGPVWAAFGPLWAGLGRLGPGWLGLGRFGRPGRAKTSAGATFWNFRSKKLQEAPRGSKRLQESPRGLERSEAPNENIVIDALVKYNVVCMT